MASLTAQIIKIGSRLQIRRDHVESTESLIAHLRKAFAPPPLAIIPRGVTVSKTKLGNIETDHLVTRRAREAILYFHGGGYVAGGPKTYHSLCAGLCKRLNAEAFLPKYRLAPENPFPAAVEDALESYQALLEHFAPEKITVAGDSAGGGLTLALLLALKDQGLPQPKCAVVFSPYADVTRQAQSYIRNDATDPMLSLAMLNAGGNVYVQDERDLTHPYASPILGDFTGLPPLLITVCEEECLRDDSYKVAQKAQAANVPVSFISRQDLFHVWPIMYPLLPEARADFKKIVSFIQKY